VYRFVNLSRLSFKAKHFNVTKLLVLGLILFLSACQTTGGDGDDGDGSGDTKLEVSLSATPLLSNSSIALSVELTGGTADSVELFSNDTLATILTAPYDFSFNAAEGSYTLQAIASVGTTSFKSNTLTVTIDKTAPTIENRTPQADSSASASADIEVSFSEAIDATSISASSVSLSDSKLGVLTSTPNLNGNSLSLSFSETLSPPSVLSLSLSGLTDLAGNPLPNETWSWSVTAGVTPPPPAPTPATSLTSLGDSSVVVSKDLFEKPVRIAGNTAGDLAVIWLDGASLNVKVWTGSSWSVLASPVSPKVPSRPDIALTSEGNPVIAWRSGEDDAETPAVESSEILVQRWNGSSWDDLGTANSSLESAAPSLKLDENNKIYVAFQASDGTNPDINVSTYDEATTAWLAVGSALDNNAANLALLPSLAVSASGELFVAWRENRSADPDDKAAELFVKNWNGSAWVSLGDSLNINKNERADEFSIALGSNDQPVVAWSEFENLENSSNVYVKQWNGAAWQQIGETVDNVKTQRAIYPSITANSENQLSVSWWEGEIYLDEDATEVFENSVYFAQWDGTTWKQFGELDANERSQGTYPDTTLANNLATVTWFENTSSGYQVYVRQAK